jgi:hypothetical protein
MNDAQGTMSGELDDLAVTVAGMLVSALAGDSWEDSKQWYAAVIGQDGRLAATRAELADAADGPARDLAVQAQVSAWTVRLRDVFEDDPAVARTLREFVAGMRAQGLLKPPAANSKQAAPATAPQAADQSMTATQPVPMTSGAVPVRSRPFTGMARGLIAAGVAVVVVAAAVIVSFQAGLFGGGASPQIRPLGWTGAQAPLPGYAAPLTSAADFDQLGGVSCPATGTCLAVGLLTARDGGAEHLLIERLSNGTWAPEQAQPPLPADANPAGSSWLGYLVCSSPSACTAVGSYSTKGGGEGYNANAGLVETLSGTTWVPASVPPPPDVAQDKTVNLIGLACPAAGGCVAAGYAPVFGSGNGGGVVGGRALIATQNGGTWTSAEAPLPSDAATTAQNAQLGFIECPGPGACIAVGQYLDKSGNQQGLIDTLANGTWTAAKAPLPGNAAAKPAVSLYGVSCASGACVAVGNYQAGRDSPKEQALIEMLPNGTAESAKAQSLLPDSESGLDAVHCVSASSCLALGGYGSGGLQFGLAATLTDGTWSTAPVSLPANATATGSAQKQNQNVFLWSVACPTTANCEAVGSYTASTGATVPLVATGTVEAAPGAASPVGAQPGATALPLGQGTFQIRGTVTQFDASRQAIALQGTVDGLALTATATGNGVVGIGFAGQHGYCGTLGVVGSSANGTLGGVPFTITLASCTAESNGALTVTYTGTWGSRQVNLTLSTNESLDSPTVAGTLGGQQVSAVPDIVLASGAPGQTSQISGTITVS